jgi:hypothetical protein
MNYSLGNMLSRGGALNPDGLALDLQFAADKTLTARKGPTPTFTRASTATFVGSDGLIQSAAINAPRFDHDPVTLACKGLLIEESRTNSLLHSANFKNTTSSYWDNVSATTVTVDQTTSPDGGVNADLLTTSAAAFDCFTRRNNIFVGSTQYTYSIFLKQGPSNHRYVGLYIGVGITAAQFPFFDFNNPTVVQIPSGTLVGTINSTRVDAFPNGWYRVSITFTTAVTPIVVYAGVYIAASNGALPVTSTAGLNAYIWGIQLELGSFPTSYIPTTTASVVRSADVCSITGSDFTGFYNQSEGTFFADATPQTVNQTVVIVGANTSASTASHFIYKSNNLINAAGKRWTAQTVSTGAQTSIVTGADVAISASKLSYAYKLNDFAFVYAGSIVGTDSSGTIPTPTTMRIGCRDDGLQINGHIAAIRYFKKRLPNAKLQSLTT